MDIWKVNGKIKQIVYVVTVRLLYTRKLDTSCQAMRQEVMPAKFQPHASQMHLKWAEIRYCAQMLCTVTQFS